MAETIVIQCKGRRRQFGFWIPIEVDRKLEALAAKTKRTKTELATAAIADFVERAVVKEQG